jgi:hypothetical protein
MVTCAFFRRWSWILPALAIAPAVAGGCSAVTEAGPPIYVTDAAVDTRPDAASDSSNLVPGDASSCRPGEVATYQPSYHPASGAYQGLCGDDLIKQYYDDCLGPNASTDSCADFKADKTSGPCAACIVTPDSATKYGPIIDHGSFVTANVAGCLELAAGALDADGGSANLLACARAVQSQAGCELAACEANCDVHDTASLDAYGTCASAADTQGCETYASAATCAETDAGQEAQCLTGFQDFYDEVVPEFCGSALDAGGKQKTPGDASYD